jgi:ketosteroid isomerase-like protein
MSEANISAVQSLYAAFSRGDIATLLNACTPDVDWESGGHGEHNEGFPVFGRRKGPEAVQEFFQTVAASLEFTEFSPREFYADKDKVFVLGRYAMVMKKSGRSTQADWVHIFTFRGGKVAKFREFTDTANIIAAYRA